VQLTNALVQLSVAAMLVGCVDVNDPMLEAASNRLSDGSQAFVTRELRPAGPPTKRPWDDDAHSLDSAIEAVGGRATIGIKIPSSDRFMTQRVRSVPDAAGFDAGIRFLENSGVEVLHRIPRIGAAVVAFGDAPPSSIWRHPLIDYVEPDRPVTPASVRVTKTRHVAPKPTAYSCTPGGTGPECVPWGIEDAGFPQQWSNWDGSGAKVLVIDHAYQRGHPDLPYIPNENCGSYIGWDGCDGFLESHGTHVLGTLAALDNGYGVIGGAHGIDGDDLYFFPLCDPADPDECLSSASAAGIDWGAAKGVQVISMSYQSYYYDLTEDAAVWSAHYYDDIVLVAAAGNHWQNNEFFITYPASLPDVIGVSGHRESPHMVMGWAAISWDRCYIEPEQDFWDSDWGPHVDISAPFQAWSTVLINGYDDEWCGTSMATPHVSAAVAIMRAKNPTLPNSTIESFLLGSATDAGAAGWDNIFGHGRLNASLAIATVQQPPPPPPPLIAHINGPEAMETWQTCSWTATYSGGSGSVSYKWFKNGAQVSTSATVYLSGPPFNLKLTVTRGVESDSDTRYIYVGSSGGCGI
jgi:hypothetical protein